MGGRGLKLGRLDPQGTKIYQGSCIVAIGLDFFSTSLPLAGHFLMLVDPKRIKCLIENVYHAEDKIQFGTPCVPGWKVLDFRRWWTCYVERRFCYIGNLRVHQFWIPRCLCHISTTGASYLPKRSATFLFQMIPTLKRCPSTRKLLSRHNSEPAI